MSKIQFPLNRKDLAEKMLRIKQTGKFLYGENTDVPDIVDSMMASSFSEYVYEENGESLTVKDSIQDIQLRDGTYSYPLPEIA